MSELEIQIENRRRNRTALVERGAIAYPHRFDHDLEPVGVRREYEHLDADALEEQAIRLRVPGRVRSLRKHGKTAFVDIADGLDRLQLMLRVKDLDESSAAVLDHLDLGDYVGAEGVLMRTRTGELTLLAESLTLLSKSLRPWPEKWHGLADVEARYRQRYVDLVVNSDARRGFELRSRLVAFLRRELEQRGFLEVETPMMQVMPGGAAARPFRTHHNALDLDLYLRVAPELYLKRLLVGGMHRVYELNRNFRNEGISTQHNPEFTMLEFYWAYADYRDLMELTEELLGGCIRELLGSDSLTWNGTEIDCSRPWRRWSMTRALASAVDRREEDLQDVESLRALAAERGIEPPAGTESYGHWLLHLFEELAEDALMDPTFILDHPTEISPLAKQHPDDPRLTERFELYIGGMEIANAFSELNDPDVQAERFRTQLEAREQGDEEAHRFDADYVQALEYGMPPAAGEGIGIDRLTMLLLDTQSIRDVILFPLLRPRLDDGEEDGRVIPEGPPAE